MPNIVLSPAKQKLIYCCFFLSGVTALIYEVLWARQLGLIIGNTMYAISLVLAAFMAGLGAGTYLVNQFMERYPKPLKIYGILEIGIGLWALMVPSLLKGVDQLHLLLHPLLEHSFILDSLLHFGLSGLVIFIPAILMGGTLPALTTCCTEQVQQMGGKLSLLYALNTLGAVVGTWWVGFYALPWLGMSLTSITAAMINLSIGTLFLMSDRFVENPVIKATPKPSSPNNKVSYFLMVGIGVAGFTAMTYEIAWTRILIMVLGSTTYAFSCILMAFLLGITLGSYIYNLLSKRISFGLITFCFIEILIGITTLLSLPAFSLLPQSYIILYNLLPSNISWSIQMLRFLIPLSIMIVPATLMGITFPLVGNLYSEETGEITKCVCKIYGSNTLGNVFGAFLTGFFFLSVLGAQNTLKLAIILNLCIGVAGLFIIKSKARLPLIVTAMLTIGLVIFHPPWDKYLMDSGVAIYTDSMSFGKSIKNRIYNSEMLYYKEGINAITTVYQQPDGYRYLRVNGKVDASTHPTDMTTQLGTGYIPAFLHPNPQNALVIGLGSGVTVRVIAQYDFIQKVDCVEIEPTVVEAAKYFTQENHNIHQNPKVNIIVEDGRGYLKSTQEKYDLIISEPSNPWIKGIGNLFSVEYYRLCQQRLNPGGIMGQWIQFYCLSPSSVKMAVNSFRQVFPNCQLWFFPPGDAVIIGSQSPIMIDLEHIEKMTNYNKNIKQEINDSLGIDKPAEALALLLLNNNELAEFTRGSDFNTDNYPLLEFRAPLSQFMNVNILNYKVARSHKKSIIPSYLKTTKRRVSPVDYYYGLGKIFLKQGFLEGADKYIKQGFKYSDRDPRLYLIRGKYYAMNGDNYSAIDDLKRSLELNPKNDETHFELARLYQTTGKPLKAETHYLQAMDMNPQDEKLLFSYIKFLGSQKQVEQALALANKLAAAPSMKSFQLWEFIGDMYLKLDNYAEARTAYERSYQLNSCNYKVNLKLSKIDFRDGRIEHALNRLLTQKDMATFYNPLDMRILDLVSNCYIQLGQYDKAAETLHEILRKNPNNYSVYKKLVTLPINQPDIIF